MFKVQFQNSKALTLNVASMRIALRKKFDQSKSLLCASVQAAEVLLLPLQWQVKYSDLDTPDNMFAPVIIQKDG